MTNTIIEMRPAHTSDAGDEQRRPIHILGISGSLRADSYNTALLRTAQDVAPDSASIELYTDLAQIPHFNVDLRDPQTLAPVQDLNQQIENADALLIATPEFNFGIPGALKDALDWASFPPPRSVLRRKPVAVLGASRSAIGTARAQLSLRQVLQETGSYVMPKPEVMVVRAHERIDATGEFTDPEIRSFVKDLVAALVDWVHLVRPDVAGVQPIGSRQLA